MKIEAMLAKEFQTGMTPLKNEKEYKEAPIGWVASEKFDGYRCIFVYEKIDDKLVGMFYSRNGKSFIAPEWFTQSMPSYELLGDYGIDGELWAGRDNFELVGEVRKKTHTSESWASIQYQVYDLCHSEKPFTERLKDLSYMTKFTRKCWPIKMKESNIVLPKGVKQCPLKYAKQTVIKSVKQMKDLYQEIIDNDGEGLMLKHPNSPYIGGRTSYLLKVKPSLDREAIIIDYKMGQKGSKYDGFLGSFICKPLKNHDTYMSIDEDEDHVFTLSGMDDTIRTNFKETHPEGTIITYECSGFTTKGLPRFGRYLRIRDDVIIKEHKEEKQSIENLSKVIDIFVQMEDYYRKNYDTFRVKTYTKINKILKTLKSDEQLKPENLTKIKGIGQGTINRICEIVETGSLKEWTKLKNKKNPLEEFLKIHGVGKQHAKKLLESGFTTIDDLRKCETISEHLNDTQLKGLHYFDDIQQRIPYEEIQQHEIYLKNTLKSIDEDSELTIAGSYRRKKPDSGDIDLLLKCSNKKTYDKFIDKLTSEGYLTCQLARGSKKYMGMGKLDISPCNRRIDIMYTKPDEYPFAILYFTGSGDFNQKMRSDALIMGYTMNEYSIKYTENKKKVDKTFLTEKEIFDFLGYDYLNPEDRK